MNLLFKIDSAFVYQFKVFCALHDLDIYDFIIASEFLIIYE